MKQLFVSFCLLLLLLFHGMDMLGKSEDMHQLTVDQGLPGMTVTDMEKDNMGRLWITTSRGLAEYNGKQFYFFPLDDAPPTYCYNLVIDPRHHSIYLSNKHGIYVLKQGTTMKHVCKEVQGLCATMTQDGLLYAGNGQGLFVYKNTKLLHHISLRTASNKHATDSIIRGICAGEGEQVWFTLRYHVGCYNTRTRRITYYPIHIQSALDKLAFHDRKLYIGTRADGLIVFDTQTGKWYQMMDFGKRISNIKASSYGRMAIATNGNGAFLLDTSTKRAVKCYRTTQLDKNKLPSDAVFTYYIDANGTDWFGLSQHGLCYQINREPLFQVYRSGLFSTENMDVTCFLIRQKQKLIGTSNGCYLVNEETGKTTYFSSKQLGANVVRAIAWYRGLYYIGLYSGGLLTINPHTLSLQRVKGPGNITVASFTSMWIAPDHRLWATSDEGLFVIDAQGEVQNYTDKNSKIGSGNIYNVVFDQKGTGWFCTGKEINCYLPENKQFKKQIPASLGLTQFERVRLFNGHKNQLYAVADCHVFVKRNGNQQFTDLQLPELMMGEVCSAFCDDQKECYWLASEKGLFRILYDQQSFQRFSDESGLKTNLVYQLSMAGPQQSTLWAATDAGLMWMNHADLKRFEAANKAPIIFNDCWKGGHQENAGSINEVITTKRIQVYWNWVSQTLRLFPLYADFAPQEGRLYEYKVDGKPWKAIRQDESILFRTFIPGHYQLAIRLAGIPSSTTTYTITVLPAMGWYAEVLLMIAISWFFWWYLRFRKRTKELLAERDTIEQSLIEEEEARQNEEMAAMEKEKPVTKLNKAQTNTTEQKLLYEQMCAYMEKEKPYLNPNLKLSDIASALSVSQSQLSIVFKYYLNENYYDFVNNYRLDEFMHYVKQGAYKQLTLTAISDQCGFRRTSFFTTFRKVKGMTPTEFIQKLK